jgi:hypothetical protein
MRTLPPLSLNSSSPSPANTRAAATPITTCACAASKAWPSTPGSCRDSSSESPPTISVPSATAVSRRSLHVRAGCSRHALNSSVAGTKNLGRTERSCRPACAGLAKTTVSGCKRARGPERDVFVTNWPQLSRACCGRCHSSVLFGDCWPRQREEYEAVENVPVRRTSFGGSIIIIIIISIIIVNIIIVIIIRSSKLEATSCMLVLPRFTRVQATSQCGRHRQPRHKFRKVCLTFSCYLWLRVFFFVRGVGIFV